MRILLAADTYPYSIDAIHQVENIGQNTWADITIMGITQTPRINRTLATLEKEFLSGAASRAIPYGKSVFTGPRWNHGKKKITTRLRNGPPAAEIIKEARRIGSDLIVIGGGAHSFNWMGDGNVPLKVACHAPCAVLAIKQNKPIKKVLCCLDHSPVPQASVEMIDQMVTLFSTDLEFAVISRQVPPDPKLDHTLSGLLTRYAGKGKCPMFQLVHPGEFKKFLSEQSQSHLLALCMGKKSVFSNLFPNRNVEMLLGMGAPSVLFLK